MHVNRLHAIRSRATRPIASRPAGTRRAARTAGVAVAGLAALTLAAGCGGGDAGSEARRDGTGEATATAGASPADTRHNQADITFAQGMIPHHEQAVRMAELAEGRAGDPQVSSLAAKIKAAQAPEIQQMTSWLTQWGAPVPSPLASAGSDPHGGPHGGEHGGMSGMMTDQEMADLATATGDDFDRRFLELMIRHHEGAVRMASTEEQEGDNAAAKALAGRIKADQTAEIKLMRDLLERR